MNTRTLKIQGMSCGHCVMALKKELENVDGLIVRSIEVGQAQVSGDGEQIDEARLQASVDEAGFKLLE